MLLQQQHGTKNGLINECYPLLLVTTANPEDTSNFYQVMNSTESDD